MSSHARCTTAMVRNPSDTPPATTTQSDISLINRSSTRLGKADLSLAAESGGTCKRNMVTSLAASSSTTRWDLAIASVKSDKAVVPWRSIELPCDRLPLDTRANWQARAGQWGALPATALEARRI